MKNLFDEISILPDQAPEETYKRFLVKELPAPNGLDLKEINALLLSDRILDTYSRPYELKGKLFDIHQYCFQFLGAGLFLEIEDITPQAFYEKYILAVPTHFAVYKLMCRLFYLKNYLQDEEKIEKAYEHLANYTKACFKYCSDFKIKPFVEQEQYDDVFKSYKNSETLFLQYTLEEYYGFLKTANKEEMAVLENILIIFCHDIFQEMEFNYKRYYLLNLFASRAYSLSRTEQKVINAICRFSLDFPPVRFHVASAFALPHYNSHYENPIELENWDITSLPILIHYLLDLIDIYFNEEEIELDEIIAGIIDAVTIHRELYTSEKALSEDEKEIHIFRALFSSMVYFLDNKIIIEEFSVEEVETFIKGLDENIPDETTMKEMFSLYQPILKKMILESK